MSTTPAVKRSIANFLAIPATSKFLDEVLAEKKPEFVSNLIALSDSDSNLAICDPAQLMKCALNATSLNLPLNKNLGFAYVIAYKGVPSFQIGYKGVLQLAIRTGAYRYINATEIREGEIIRNKITGALTFLSEKLSAPIVGYLAFLELMTGFSASLYMSLDEIEAHALRFSKMYAADKQYKSAKSKWSDPAAREKMALKTVLKGLLGTYGLMTTDFARAFASDDDHAESDRGRTFVDAEIIPQEEPYTPNPRDSSDYNSGGPAVKAPMEQGEPVSAPKKMQV